MNLLYYHRQAYCSFYNFKTLIWHDTYLPSFKCFPVLDSLPLRIHSLTYAVWTASVGFLLHTAFCSVVSGSSAYVLVNHSLIKLTSKLSVHFCPSYTIISLNFFKLYFEAKKFHQHLFYSKSIVLQGLDWSYFNTTLTTSALDIFQ